MEYRKEGLHTGEPCFVNAPLPTRDPEQTWMIPFLREEWYPSPFPEPAPGLQEEGQEG